jgi:16S rRNA (cytidine1402-2'-O)-methyltransferase
VARELTKTHEEFVRDTLAALAERYAGDRPLGEITIVVGARRKRRSPATTTSPSAPPSSWRGETPRDVAQRLAEEAGRPRREIYELVLKIKTATHPR